jgi:hypothetical protein
VICALIIPAAAAVWQPSNPVAVSARETEGEFVKLEGLSPSAGTYEEEEPQLDPCDDLNPAEDM